MTTKRDLPLNWLIAEDETDIRNLVATMCKVWGHTPMPFESGNHVWRWLDEFESGEYHGELPDFALLDIRMPGYRGDEVSERLRSIPELQHIPIVLMTAFVMTDEEKMNMMNETGVDDIINKPLPEFQELHGILHSIIEHKTG